MSKISLAPAVAGTGIFTIASPGTSTNRTLTLPDDTGTIVTNSGNQAGSFTTLNTSGQVVFNDAGADVDFRVEGDTDANLLFVDASTDRVGIGTNTPDTNTKFTVNGAMTLLGQNGGHGASRLKLGQDTTAISQIRFYGADNSTPGILQFTGSSADGNVGGERARITSGGYFKASNTGTYLNATSTYHELRNNANSIGLLISNPITSGYADAQLQITFTGYTPDTAGAWFLYCSDTTNQKGAIQSTGTFESRTGVYGGVSDFKLKQDIVDANSQWDDIKGLRVVKYRFKDEVAADPNYPSHLGVIAQEAEIVSPGLVFESPDFENVEVPVLDDEGNPVFDGDGNPQVTTERQATGTVTKGVKYSILYMKAVKALQEAMERIETLEASNTALEARIAALETGA